MSEEHPYIYDRLCIGTFHFSADDEPKKSEKLLQPLRHRVEGTMHLFAYAKSGSAYVVIMNDYNARYHTVLGQCKLSVRRMNYTYILYSPLLRVYRICKRDYQVFNVPACC